MAGKRKYERCDKVGVYRWNGWRYVLVRTMTPEEAEAEDLAMREKAKRTKERRKKIREIVRENKFDSYEDALDYVLNGGESTAVFLEYMGKDKAHWMQEIMLAKREREERENADN